MRPAHRIVLGFLVARLIFGVVFLASGFAHWTVPWYVPLEHRWVIARTVPGVAMDWYGRSALALTSGAFAGWIAYGASRFARWGAWLVRPKVIEFVAHFGALMLLNDVLFYVFTLIARHPVPSPIPAWYCPR